MARRGARAGTLARAALAAGTLLLAACGREAAPPPAPHIVLYLLDAARADFLSSYGHAVRTTPRIDALAASGVRFARHYSHAHTTTRSVPQLFTSRYDAPALLRYAPGHGLPWWARDEAQREETLFLPRALAAAGYRSVMVTAHPWTSADSRFGAGFEEVHEVPAGRGYAPAARVFAVAERVVEAHARERPSVPLFLFVHLLDTHTPHDPPPGDPFFSLEALGWSREEWASRQPGLSRKYIEEPPPELVEAFRGAMRSSYARVDAELGRFHDRVEEQLGGPLLHAITSDHGDAAGEGGWFEHPLGTFGTDATHHIPLVLEGEGLVPEGVVVERPTATVDVVPTLLELAGVPPPAGQRLHGRSLAALVEGSARTFRERVFYAYRLGWSRTRLGSREPGRTVVVTEDDAVHTAEEGGVHFEPAGRYRGEAGGAVETPLHEFVQTYRRLDRRRAYEARARQMTVPPMEMGLAREASEGAGACGASRGWRFARRKIVVREETEACEPLRVRVSLPAGRYRLAWRARFGGPEAALRLGVGDAPRRRLEAEDAEAELLRLGELRHDGGTLRLVVEGIGRDPAQLGPLVLERLEAGAPEEVEALSPETVEQLQSLGYLQGGDR